MALTIKEQNGIFFAQGIINSSTSELFKNHIEFLLNFQNSLEINIDAITKIDTNGLLAFYKLYKKALIYNIDFKITGKGCEELLQEINCNLVA